MKIRVKNHSMVISAVDLDRIESKIKNLFDWGLGKAYYITFKKIGGFLEPFRIDEEPVSRFSVRMQIEAIYNNYAVLKYEDFDTHVLENIDFVKVEIRDGILRRV